MIYDSLRLPTLNVWPERLRFYDRLQCLLGNEVLSNGMLGRQSFQWVNLNNYNVSKCFSGATDGAPFQFTK